MIPTAYNDNIFGKEMEVAEEPSATFAITSIKNEIRLKNKIDEIEAVKQAIYLILSIERYNHIIYSWDYGIELADLFGKPKEYVIPELSRRISEALIQDDRIDAVDNFHFVVDKDVYFVDFVVSTKFGKINASKEVIL